MMMKRFAAISIAVLAAACGDSEKRELLVLPGDELYPEGITAAADGTFFVGSIREGTIERIAPGATSADPQPFVAAGVNGLVSALGLLADGDRLWACSSDPGLSRLTGTGPPGLKWFDLASGAPLGSADLPGGGLCNDLARDGAGNLYLTDSFGPRILMLPAGGQTLGVWLEASAFAGNGFNLNGIEVLGGAVYTVKFNSGQLFRIPIESDGRAGAMTEIALDRALEQPDGLRVHGDDLVVVEGVGRLSRIQLGANATATVTTIRDGLANPTTAALVGREAWVVEGQLGHLLDPTTGPPALPFKVVPVSLDGK